jgi:hypothetical protein
MCLRLDDQDTDVVETLHLGLDQTVITVSQEADDIMARCAAHRAAQPAFSKPPTFRLVADIPVALVTILAAQGMDIINDPEAMRKFLNDPAFAAFRTTTGRV